jgi:hypothetical protein
VNPVISLDVSKGESHVQAFADRGTPYGEIFRFIFYFFHLYNEMRSIIVILFQHVFYHVFVGANYYSLTILPVS